MATIRPAAAKRNFDADAFEVRANAAPTTSYVPTTGFDCRGFREVDFIVKVTTHGSLSKITVVPQTGLRVGSATQWSPYLTETVSAGVATTSQYTIELTDPTPASGGTVFYLVSLPVKGRYLRLNLKANAAAGSVFVAACRRV